MPERIWVAGHKGMVGSAIVRLLRSQQREVVTVGRDQLDLRNQVAVEKWMRDNRPSSIVFAAAKVGGILANDTLPAEFLYDNICLQTNVIHAAHLADVDRIVFLGSSCIYPKFAKQPIEEDSLLTGPLEPTNEWYAIAKIAGIKLCQAYMKQYGRQYVSVMPCNLYGPGDNFDLQTSHVMPALIRKFTAAHEKNLDEVVVWGSGTPLREFLHVDDLAAGVVHCLDHYFEYEHINCGSAEEVTIRRLAEIVGAAVGFTGQLTLDRTKPDGTPRKVLDSSRLRNVGWTPQIKLVDGVRTTVEWFHNNYGSSRGISATGSLSRAPTHS